MKTQNEKELGLYKKFDVKRLDGSSEKGFKHANCEFFILDLEHDKFARSALIAYAESCYLEYPQLSIELRAKANKILNFKGTKNAL